MTTLSIADIPLVNGQWIRRGMVVVWQQNPKAEVEPDEQRPTYNPSELIACPTCHARMDESCEKRDGSVRRRSHGSRLVKRVCSCGGPVRPREPMCGFCRAEAAVEVAA